MKVRPYRLLRGSEIESIESYLGTAVSRWWARWMPDDLSSPPIGELVRMTSPAAVSFTSAIEIRPDVTAYIEFDDRTPHLLVSAMLGRDGPGPTAERADGPYSLWARPVARDAVTDLLRLIFQDGPEREYRWQAAGSVPTDISAPGSGAVLTTLVWSGVEHMLILDGAAVEIVLRNAGYRRERTGGDGVARLVHVTDAISGLGVGLGVRTRATQLSYAEFGALEVGDVLVLEHGANEPLMVHASSSVSLGSAGLGRRVNKRAIQFVSTE